MTFRSIALAAGATALLAIPNAAQAFFWGHHGATYAYAGPVAGAAMGQATTAVNMRTCGSASCDRILTIPGGAQLLIIGTAGNWYQVSYGAQQGFVAARYVSTGPAPLSRTVTYSSSAIAPATVTYATTAFPRGYEHVAYGRHPTAIRPLRTAAAFEVPVTVASPYETRFASTRTVTFASPSIAATAALPPLPPRSAEFGYCATPVWDAQNQAWFDGCRWGYNNGWYVAPPLVTRY
jgi:uncharacterized protein YraI